MNIAQISKEALRIKKIYSEYEEKNFGRKWSREELFMAFVSDVGDLSKLVLAKKGVVKIENLEEKIGHEFSDCFWAILVLANEYNIDIEKVFLQNMKTLEKKILDKHN